MPKDVPIQSIKRALDLLDYLLLKGLWDDGLPLQTLADHLDVAATTAHNILRTMIVCGYVEQDSRRGYRLGRRCRDISRSGRLALKLDERAAGLLHSLAEKIGESVVLATLLNGSRYPLLRADGHQLIKVDSAVESHRAFFEVVTGRVLAAYASPSELEDIIGANGLPGPAWDGIDDRAGLERALKGIRRQGLAEENSPEKGLFALAVPVLDAGGDLLAALGCHLPSFRAEREHVEIIREAVVQTAADLRKILET